LLSGYTNDLPIAGVEAMVKVSAIDWRTLKTTCLECDMSEVSEFVKRKRDGEITGWE
jgi:hypothetical protein